MQSGIAVVAMLVSYAANREKCRGHCCNCHRQCISPEHLIPCLVSYVFAISCEVDIICLSVSGGSCP